jgi:hypothetical protein
LPFQLRRTKLCPDSRGPNIVYLASAATLNDYQVTVFPYLMRYNVRAANPAKRRPVDMYHLTLHREAEVTERWTGGGFGVIDWPLRGSLLMCIDSFLSQPATRYEHTSGRFTNLLRVLHDTPQPIWRTCTSRRFHSTLRQILTSTEALARKNSGATTSGSRRSALLSAKK